MEEIENQQPHLRKCVHVIPPQLRLNWPEKYSVLTTLLLRAAGQKEWHQKKLSVVATSSRESADPPQSHL